MDWNLEKEWVLSLFAHSTVQECGIWLFRVYSDIQQFYDMDFQQQNPLNIVVHSGN
jgi:hypothetical protein